MEAEAASEPASLDTHLRPEKMNYNQARWDCWRKRRALCAVCHTDNFPRVDPCAPTPQECDTRDQ